MIVISHVKGKHVFLPTKRIIVSLCNLNIGFTTNMYVYVYRIKPYKHITF